MIIASPSSSGCAERFQQYSTLGIGFFSNCCQRRKLRGTTHRLERLATRTPATEHAAQTPPEPRTSTPTATQDEILNGKHNFSHRLCVGSQCAKSEHMRASLNIYLHGPMELNISRCMMRVNKLTKVQWPKAKQTQELANNYARRNS